METKKLLVSVALSLSLASSALIAEESGVFVGVGVGRGAAEAKVTGADLIDPNSDKVLKANSYETSYEIIAGYKQFFTPSFGLRYYANLTYADWGEKSDKSNLMNYGVNIDALYNFIASEDANFGAFVGIGVGGNTIKAEDIDFLEAAGAKVKKTHLGVALNVGLRSVIDSKHSLEAIVRVPLVEMTPINESGVKLTYTRQYNIGARYVYSF